MATLAQRQAFIAEIAPCAQQAYRTLGKVLPSVCIGMACIESGYGTSQIMRGHNAYFGQKVGSGKTATKYWDGKFFTSKTKEEYTIGLHTTISAAFRAYTAMQLSALNYYELLNTSLYKRVHVGVPYAMQMQQIKLCGYMTSSTEVNSVIKTIEKYGLTKYDFDTVVSVILPTHPSIKFGSKGAYVLSWQNYLNTQGYVLVPDGLFGSATLRALKDWQKKNGLDPDGIVNSEEWQKIGVY